MPRVATVRLSLPTGHVPPTHAPRVASWGGAVGSDVAETLRGRTGTKLLHFVRHAQGFHNVDSSVMKMEAGFDAQLTPEGRDQCATLQRLTDGLRPELVITSPLTRTLQTAQLCFRSQRLASGAPLVALESVRETVNYLCDARRCRTTLEAEFPDVDFSGCPDNEDAVWAHYERLHGTQADFTNHRESADLPALAARARQALSWIAARPETEIVIVSHQAFLWNTLNMGLGRAHPKLPPIYDFGDNVTLERWMCGGFQNCECRSVLADFNVAGSF